MEPILTDEQRLLQDSVARMLSHAGGVKRTRGLRGRDGGFDAGMHARMGAEGWFGLLVPEALGGSGLGLTELAVVLMEAGRVLAPEPIGATAVVARSIALGIGSTAHDALLAGVLEGRIVVVPAVAGDADASGVTWQLPSKETGVRLDGKVSGVAMSATCDGFLVATSDDMLAYVPRVTPGVTTTARATVDGRSLGDLALADVAPELTLSMRNAGQELYDLLLFCAAAELVGVMGAALDITVEYVKTRKQVGKPIGSFQAIQHRAVDDFARLVSARSLLFQVAAQGLPVASQMASALKAHCGGMALEVTKSAIQMHGAIGFTEECDIGLYLKRAMWLSAWLGNERVHRRRYSALNS